MASRMVRVSPKKRFAGTWKKHMQSARDADVIDINYNKWFSDVNYRRNLAEILGLTFTDEGINDVKSYATSSFDKRTFDGKAQEMKVLERWKELRKSKEYWAMIDQEMIDMSKSYFNFTVER